MKNIMVKKVLAAVCALAMFPAVMPAYAADMSLDFEGESGLLAYMSEDFEDCEVDDVITAKLPSGAAPYTGAGMTNQIVDDNGNKVIKITKGADVGGNTGIKLDPSAKMPADADYWVQKYDLKNGDNYDNRYPNISLMLQFRVDGTWVGFPDNNNKKDINAYDWNEYIFIAKADGSKKTKLILNGVDMGETTANRANSATAYYGLQVIEMETKDWERVMYVDNMEVFGFKFKVSCDLDKNTAAVPTDTVEVKVDGFVDETTLDTVTIRSDEDSDISVSSRSYSDGVLTLNLSKTMEDFTNYKIDWSGVKAKIGGISAEGSASFKTTGDLVVENSLTANADDKLVSGVNTVTLSTFNTTDIDANVTLVLELVEDGKTTALGYRDATVGYNESESLIVTFVADAGAKIKAYVKNSINGTVLYGDEFTVSASGITSQKAENITDEQPTVDNTADRGFYSLTLGEDGARKMITAVKEGLIDCTADVGASDGVLIAVVKKDGKLVDYCFAKGSGVLHAVVTADKKSTVEMYTWGDELGTSGRGVKATLAAN